MFLYGIYCYNNQNVQCMKAIFIFLIFLWILLSFFNIFYNLKKTVSEIHEWGSLSDNQKRNKIFGYSHDFFTIIKDHTEKDTKILIFSKDTKTHFLSIYYLYPRRITSTDNEKDFLKLVRTKKYQYIAAYDIPILARDYNQIASFSSMTSTDYGSVYKIK